MVLPNAPVEFAIAIYSTAVWGAMIFFPNHRKTRQYMNTALPLYPLLIAYVYFAVVGLKPMRLDQVNPLDVLFGIFIPAKNCESELKFYRKAFMDTLRCICCASTCLLDARYIGKVSLNDWILICWPSSSF